MSSLRVRPLVSWASSTVRSRPGLPYITKQLLLNDKHMQPGPALIQNRALQGCTLCRHELETSMLSAHAWVTLHMASKGICTGQAALLTATSSL